MTFYFVMILEILCNLVLFKIKFCNYQKINIVIRIINYIEYFIQICISDMYAINPISDNQIKKLKEPIRNDHTACAT